MTANSNLSIDRIAATYDGQTGQGPQTTNRFQLIIPTPSGLQTSGQNSSSNTEMWCRAAPLPDLTLSLHPVVRYGYGLVENKPGPTKFRDMSIVVISDDEGKNMKFFHDWIMLINNHDFSEGINTSGTQWEVAYKSDYSVDMSMITYNKSNNPIQKIKYIEAFPYSVKGSLFDWADTNKILEFTVGFTYFSWNYDNSNL